MDDDDMDLIQLVDDDELARETSAAAAASSDDQDLLTDVQLDRPPSPTDSATDVHLDADPSTSAVDDQATAAAADQSPSRVVRTLPSLAELRQVALHEPPSVHPHDSLRGPPGGLRGCLLRGALSLGVMQIIVGIFTVPVGVVAVVYCASLAFVGHGIWSSILCILSGTASIISWSRESAARTAMHMTLATISAVCSALMTGLAIYSSVVDAGSSEAHYNSCAHNNIDISFLVDMLLAIMGMIQLIISVINAAIACRVCCINRSPPPMYCVSNDFVLFDGVRCWTRGDFEHPEDGAAGTDCPQPPPYTLPPYSPPERPPPYK